MPSTVSDRYEEIARKSRESLAACRGTEAVRVQVGSATCENAAGAREVWNEFEKHIRASGRADVVLHRTGCTGRCAREPIVGVFAPGKMPVKYQGVDREAVHRIFTEHIQNGEPVRALMLAGGAEPERRYEVLFCEGKRCDRARRIDIEQVLKDRMREAGIAEERVRLMPASCFGLCASGEAGRHIHIMIRPDRALYRLKDEEEVGRVVTEHLGRGRVQKDLLSDEPSVSQRFFDLYGDLAFFNRQSRIALRNAGVVDPESIEEYIAYDGFRALAEVLAENDPDAVIEKIARSNLRGRGGGGFPTGKKWAFARQAGDPVKYMICNADEGDPGAFMDRSMLESDPFSVVEGLLIGGFATGASHGYFYIRAEYPLAIRRIRHAIETCRNRGLLGENILGADFSFDLEVRLGAGAFVCGEETALIHSIEGVRGQPRIRPPYPSTKGLWGHPTTINNVETYANVPAILLYGAAWFASLGTEGSGGTKVFALAGKVEHTGLVEVPMGTTLREVVEEIGGGVPGGKRIKAVQTGGPAGGCIPVDRLDTEVDFDSLMDVGSIMGSGGMIVLDEDDCMVGVARFFMEFSADESCGKCTPCREGTTRMLEILDKMMTGLAEPEDIVKLERLAKLVQRASLCGLGRAAPNPILSTLRHYRHEYEAHVRDKICPAKSCTALIHYEIDPEKCVGCTLCAKNCPVACIDGERRKAHVIDQSRCIKCGRCFEVCRFDAVKKL